MSTGLIEIRRAKPADAKAIAAVHDAAWRTAYRGLIPGVELERMVERRGPRWWDAAIRRGSRLSVLLVGDDLAGYVNYGGNRAKSLPYGGEIYEIYLQPLYQGLGFGQRLFSAARRDLSLATGSIFQGGVRIKNAGKDRFRLAAVASAWATACADRSLPASVICASMRSRSARIRPAM